MRKLYEQNNLFNRKNPVRPPMGRLFLSWKISMIRRIPKILSGGLYAAYAWAVIGFLAPFIWILVVLLPGYPLRRKFAHKTAHFLHQLLRIPLLINGMENLPKKGPFVVVSNHASYIDGFVLTAIFPYGARFVAKSELTGHFISRIFLERLQTVFVERFDKQKRIKDSRRLIDLARTHPPLIILPEGTFTPMPGLLPFHIGAFLAAAKAGVPVVPVALCGTRYILRDESWFPRQGTITITIGHAIAPAAVTGRNQSELWTAALRSLNQSRDFILKNCDEPDLSHEKAPIFEESVNTRK